MKVLLSILRISSGTRLKSRKGSSLSFSLMRTLTSRTLSWPRRITWLMKMSLSSRRLSGRRLSGILENVWLRRSLKRSQRRDPKTQSPSLRLRSVRASLTSSIHLKFLRTKMILMKNWYVHHPQKQFNFFFF